MNWIYSDKFKNYMNQLVLLKDVEDDSYGVAVGILDSLSPEHLANHYFFGDDSTCIRHSLDDSGEPNLWYYPPSWFMDACIYCEFTGMFGGRYSE